MFHRPTPSHIWVLGFMHCTGACIVTRIDVLLCVRAGKTNLVVRAPPLHRARTTGVAVFNIEPTRETNIHVCISFYNVGICRGGATVGWCSGELDNCVAGLLLLLRDGCCCVGWENISLRLEVVTLWRTSTSASTSDSATATATPSTSKT